MNGGRSWNHLAYWLPSFFVNILDYNILSFLPWLNLPIFHTVCLCIQLFSDPPSPSLKYCLKQMQFKLKSYIIQLEIVFVRAFGYLCRDSAARSTSSHWSADYRTTQTGKRRWRQSFIMQCTTLINTDLKNTNSALLHKGQLTICTLFSSSWGMANVEEGTCVRGQAPACNHISHCA